MQTLHYELCAYPVRPALGRLSADERKEAGEQWKSKRAENGGFRETFLDALGPYTKVPILSRYVFCCTHVYCPQLNRRLQLITSKILQQALQLVYCKLKYYV